MTYIIYIPCIIYVGSAKPHNKCKIDKKFYSIDGLRAIEYFYFIRHLYLYNQKCPYNKNNWYMFFKVDCINMWNNIDETCKNWNTSSNNNSGDGNKNNIPRWWQQVSKYCKRSPKDRIHNI
jgi:hypothetical protein